MVHVLIVALNYIEGSLNFENLSLLGRRPNSVQASIHKRLMALITACDQPEDPALTMVPGRSGPEFIARLTQLEHFAKRCGHFDPQSYGGGPADLTKKKVGRTTPDDAVAAAVQPYTSLNADRLKLVGEGKWDIQKHLEDDILWLPYVEPLVLRHNQDIDYSIGPNLQKEQKMEYLKLAKKWANRDLLALTAFPPSQDTFSRVFNARKDEHVDRQIGDRRLANAAEYSLSGPSKHLPAGYLLTSMHAPLGTYVVGSITDRKDFYHQCKTSRQRATSNITPFAFNQNNFLETKAYKDWIASNPAKKSREAGGDRLGMGPRSILAPDADLYPCFQAIFQEDHLGVEFALAGHRGLLRSASLLHEDNEVLGNKPFPMSSELEGLVIDDYFALSVMHSSKPPTEAGATAKLAAATEAYNQEEVLGSPEKDVRSSRHFKVIGAEVDTSLRTTSLGLALVGAPLAKRVALSVLSLRVARLPIISRALGARLAGNWTSVFMFRRCLTSILSGIYNFSIDSSAEETEIYELPRSVAEELVLSSVLSFIAVSDISAEYDEKIFASDASLAKGAVVSRRVRPEVAKVLWLGGDKKGAYTKLDSHFRHLSRAVGDHDIEDNEIDEVFATGRPTQGLDFSFDFIEICAGCASVSKSLARLGHPVCTPIELSDSAFFDVTDTRLISWLCEMLKYRRIRAIMVEPVCTTFSPAAHPACRSYDQPKGYCMTDAKTKLGNCIAFRCLFLIWVASIYDCPALAEQPRLSKMAWLPIWRFLIRCKDFEEAIIASCQFGSIHRKEFRMLGRGLDMSSLERRCPGGHDHVRVEGKMTKQSAIYTPALADHLARHFHLALRKKARLEALSMRTEGIESVVVNDVLLTGEWKIEKAWTWKKASHINILESHAYLEILKQSLREGGDRRIIGLLDSRVAKCSQAKGRSSAKALGPSLKKSMAWQVAGGLYPALGFAPTRLNTADAPTRDRDLPVSLPCSLVDLLPGKQLQKIHSFGFSRIAATWLRLVLLLQATTPTSSLHSCSGAATRLSRQHGLSYPLDFWNVSQCIGLLLGFFIGLLVVALCLATLASSATSCLSISMRKNKASTFSVIGFFLVFLPIDNSGFGTGVFGRVSLGAVVLTGAGKKTVFHGSQPLPLVLFATVTSAMPTGPNVLQEAERASRRAGTVLVADRVVRQQTRNRREVLLSDFNFWLQENAGTCVAELVDAREVNAEEVSTLLVEYGKSLFYAGKSYGRFSETINAVGSRRPLLRRQLVGAWDLAFAWVADEPHQHHPAMPLSVLLAFSTLALLWGWPREAALWMMTWSGILRIGESLAATRRELVLPQDMAPGHPYALLRIRQPQTRGVGAKNQAARIDPEDVVQLLSAVFGSFERNELLWNNSAGLMRKRFAAVQRALGLATVKTADCSPLELSSLRPGGATYLLHKFEDAELVRRRGRWISAKVMEVYLQEVTVATYEATLSTEVRERIRRLAGAYSQVHQKAIFFLRSHIPPSAWPRLW